MNETPSYSDTKPITSLPTATGKSLPNSIRVLDHGFVRLVDHMGNDLSVVRSARQSYDAAWRVGENEGSDEKLMHYLWRNHHTTPFESATFTFEVHAPIFVFRQWHRHRTWSFNELSARYTELADEFYMPAPDIVGFQSKSNKQGRSIEERPEIHGELDAYQNTCEHSFHQYRLLLKAGWPRELARSVLPVSTYSNMFATVNLLNLLKFLTLRTDSHAQYEIRVYADAVLELIRPIVPVCVSAWEAGITKAPQPPPVMTVGLATPMPAMEQQSGNRYALQDHGEVMRNTPVDIRAPLTPPDPRQFDFSGRYQDGLHFTEYVKEGTPGLWIPDSEGLAIVNRRLAGGDCDHLTRLPLKANSFEWSSLAECYRWMYDLTEHGYRLRENFHEHWGKI